MTMATEIELQGHTYQIGRLAAMDQFHVARRLAPVIASMGLTVAALAAAGKAVKDDTSIMSILGPVADVVARMSDEDTSMIIHKCLSVVKRLQSDNRYAPIQQGDLLRFNDIEMPTMLRLTVEVVKENLGGFFPQLPAA